MSAKSNPLWHDLLINTHVPCVFTFCLFLPLPLSLYLALLFFLSSPSVSLFCLLESPYGRTRLSLSHQLPPSPRQPPCQAGSADETLSCPRRQALNAVVLSSLYSFGKLKTSHYCCYPACRLKRADRVWSFLEYLPRRGVRGGEHC